MPSRKRKLTASTSNYTSKKVKRSSPTIENTRSTAGSKEIISVDPQDKFYKVRDILDEKRGKYLIDWEDDPETGKKYSPTWEPKAHANSEAITYWRSKKSVLKSSKGKQSAPAPPSQAPYLPPSSSEQASNGVPPEREKSLRKKPSRNVKGSSSPSTEDIGTTLNKSTDSETTSIENPDSSIQANNNSPSPITVDPPGIAVQISPHSSIDPQLYPQFSSQALDTITQPKSQEEDQVDSGLGESSPIPSNPLWAIPDSQSLEDSSSYVVNQTQADVDLGATQDSTKIDSSAVLKADLNGSISRATDISDSIEDFPTSESTSPVSQPSERRLSYSGSVVSSPVPLPTNFEEIQPEPEAPKLLNPKVVDGELERQPVFEDSQQKSPNLASGLPTFQHSVDNHIHAVPSRRDLTHSFNPSITEADKSLPFESQVPFVSNSQTYKLQENIDSSIADEFWQGAQLIPSQPVRSSHSSAYSPRRESTPVQSPIGSQYNSRADSHAFVNPQDLIVSRELESINDPVLIPRDPNSQSSKISNLAQPKEIIAIQEVKPSEISLEDLPSSSLREVPSQLPAIPASNPPPRPIISSEASMSDNKTPTSSPALVEPLQPPLQNANPGPNLGERLRIMRAESAAKLAAKKAATRAALQANPALYDSPDLAFQLLAPKAKRSQSPSVVSQRTPIEPVGDSRLDVRAVDVPLLPRTIQTDSYTPSRPSKLALHREISQVQGTRAFDMPRLGHMEFVVPLPAPASVRDQYVAMINHVGKDIQRFHESENPDAELTAKMENFIREITNVTTHTDLVDDTVGSEDMKATDLAVWAKIRSSKFEFLDRLIERMRDRDEHIAIVAQGGRLLDIIETFLKGKHVRYNRPDMYAKSVPKTTKGRLHLSIIASGEEDCSQLPQAADLVIAFDGSFNAKEAQVDAMRSHVLNVGELSPVVHLLIYSSAEHIQKCLPDSITRVERLKLLVSCVTFAREQVGELRPEESTVDACAEEVSIFVQTKLNSDHWTLPAIKPIEIDGITWESSQDIIPRTQSEPRSLNHEPSTVLSKRSLDTMEEDTPTQKRHRTTPGPDVTHISDSVAHTSQVTVNELQNALHEAQSELSGAREALQGAQNEIAYLKAFQANREAGMQATIASDQSRLRERIDDLEALQSRYEDQYTAYHTLRHEKDDLAIAMAGLELKIVSQNMQIESLKEDKIRITGELQVARDALLLSAIPERAELESALANSRELLKTQEQLQRKVNSLTTDFEFTREQYQIASASAAESASRITALESENVELRRKASGQAVRLREVNKTVEEERLRQRIEQLELMVKDRDQILDKREREVRGRGVQTRAGSVQPRSPKPSSRAGSRAASPLPGLLGVGTSKPGSGLRFG